MTKAKLNVQALHAALDQKRRAKKLSWRQVAAEAEVGPSTLSRMTKGKRPDVDSFAALVQWLGVPADTFLSAPADTQEETEVDGETFAVLSTHLKADRSLSPETVDALQDLLGAVERLMASSTESEKGDGD